MVARIPGVEFGNVYYRRCDNRKTRCLTKNVGNYNSIIKLTQACRSDIFWWERNILSTWAPMQRETPVVTVFLDASKLARRGVFEKGKTGGMWTRDVKERHNNELEIVAAVLTLKTFCRDMRRVHVLNQNRQHNRSKSTRKAGGRKAATRFARHIWVWCIERRIWLTATYIPGARNVDAYAQSRTLHDNSEWSLNEEVSLNSVKCGEGPALTFLHQRQTTKLRFSAHNSQTQRHKQQMRLPLPGQNNCFMLSITSDCLVECFKRFQLKRQYAL